MKKIKYSVFIVLILLVTFTCKSFLQALTMQETADITGRGQFIADSIMFNGIQVDAIYNTKLYNTENSSSTAATDTTYSCAAFVKKFYSKVYGINVHNLNTKSWPLVDGNPSQFVVTTTPQVGDLVYQEPNGSCHWAIIKEIEGNNAVLIEQNYHWTSNKKIWVYINRNIDINSGKYIFYRYIHAVSQNPISNELPDTSTYGVYIPDLNLKAAIIQQLGLGTNYVTEEDMQKLTILKANSKDIYDLTGLSYAKNLTTLYLEGNRIDKIEGLSKLTKLKQLYLGNNQIYKIEGLSKLTALTKLDISSNYITTMQGISTLNKLTYLNLDNNNLRAIQGLTKLNSLSTLHLSDNNITKIQGLSKTTNLITLHVDNNKITKIQGLTANTKLSDLSLSNNKIIKLEGLSKLKKLLQFNIQGNVILNKKDIATLPGHCIVYID